MAPIEAIKAQKSTAQGRDRMKRRDRGVHLRQAKRPIVSKVNVTMVIIMPMASGWATSLSSNSRSPNNTMFITTVWMQRNMITYATAVKGFFSSQFIIHNS